MFEHLNISLYGKVQGVFLRRTVRHEAVRIGLKGFVENKPDGSVYIEAEGKPEKLEEFVSWLKSGAGASDGDYKIGRVEVDKGGFKAFDEEFEIKG